jgi:hypothetical protein
MAKGAALGARFVIDGYPISNDVGSVSQIACPQGQFNVTGLDKTAHERIGLLRDGAISFEPFFGNTDTTGSHDVLKTLPTTDRAITFAVSNAVGAAAVSIVGKEVNYDGNRAADGSLMFASNMVGNGYGMEWGKLLTNGIVTSTAAENLASRDDGAATTFGLQAYLHVLAFTGTSVTVTLQDSADNSSFAAFTGSAFTAASAIGSQRIATANNATIRRYLRCALTGTYSNAIILVNVVRNEIAGQVF